MFRFDHRLSKDIDIFTHDARALSFLTPRLNAVSEAASVSYEEQANAVKLVLAEGDIDFIVAGPVLPNAETAEMTFQGRTVSLDATVEILAKKLLYRADSFKARDVFDMAVALAVDPASAHAAIAATRRAHPALSRRLSTLAKLDPATLSRDLLPSETGRRFLPGMVQTVHDAIRDSS